ncbi:MAG: adenylate/guanylate cyclase [Verrucomicrobiales bacterium]|nr:adenylate/guanylate cyclase [Verrucomicrobiales bacterium]
MAGFPCDFSTSLAGMKIHPAGRQINDDKSDGGIKSTAVMAAFLIQRHPPAHHPLQENGSVVGRGTAATVRIEEPSISREHARILYQSGKWRIMDLGSANGTLLNNMPVKGMEVLHDGDVLRLGNATFEFSSGAQHGDSPDTLGCPTFLNAPELRQVVMLVADLKGFTPLSTQLAPVVLATAVRYWCRECQRILESHSAKLDKFIGDCAFAWWNWNTVTTRSQAVMAARALLAIAPPPESVLDCGVALHCGEVALCRMPDASFTLLGAEVNTTFRIEALTRQLKHRVLVSRAFVKDGTDSNSSYSDCGQHFLKGLSLPLDILALNLTPPEGEPEV